MREKIPFPHSITNMPSLNGSFKITGKPVLIYIWSNSCQTCLKQLQSLQRELQHLQSQCDILYVHMPRSHEDFWREPIERLIKEQKWRMPVVLDEQLIITNALRVRFVPAVFLFDRELQLRFSQQGTLSSRYIRERIEKII